MKRIYVIIPILLLSLVSALSLSGCSDDSATPNGEVKVYCFGDYLDPELIDEFEKETGIEVVLDTFDTNEEMYPVVANESVKYDVICASDYMIEKLIAEDKLSAIDHTAIPNVANIDSYYMDKCKAFDSENKYSLPHTYGVLGIMYNTDNVEDGSIVSWKDLWDKKYDQQVVMPDSIRDTMAIALKAKGYSINTSVEGEIAEATQYLIEQKDMVYKYANDSARDILIGESADIAVVWSGEVLYSIENNESLKFVIPEEGTEEFFDMWAIPKSCENEVNAQKWIDFMLSKESAVANFEYLTYSIPNVAVIELVDSEDELYSHLFPSEDVLSKCEMLHSLDFETDQLYSDYWKEFKAK